MRRHKDPSRRQPKQKTAQAEDSPSGRQPKRTTQAQKTPTTPTADTTATSAGALHPIRGAAPDMGRCTRYVAVHPNRRGALPTDRVQCPNTQEKTRNWHTEPLTATPLHAQLGPTGGRMGTPPTPPPTLRPTPAQSDTSYTLTCKEPDYLSAYNHPQVRSLAEIKCRNAPTGAPTNPALDVPQTSSPQLDEPQINELEAADRGDPELAENPESVKNDESPDPGPEEAPTQPTA